jgi:hypothetical protein
MGIGVITISSCPSTSTISILVLLNSSPSLSSMIIDPSSGIG